MKINRLLVVFLLSSVLVGCAGKTIPLSDYGVDELQGKSITSTTRENSRFLAGTFSKLVVPLVGSRLAFNAGDRIIEDNDIDDPTNYISQQILTTLSVEHNLNIVNINQEHFNTPRNSVSKISEQYKMADYVLDIMNVGWGFMHFPTNYTRYKVGYLVKLRLINTKNRQVVALGYCNFESPDKLYDAPSYYELLRNKAERLKTELKMATNHCIDDLKRNVLGI